MLDQDTACALLTVADEHAARIVLVGDRHQLPAVGRGGVLDLAHRWADPAGCVTLDVVHRFTHQTTTADGLPTRVPDNMYAALTLAMRLGENPAATFDALYARGQIRLHGSEHDRHAAIAEEFLAEHLAGGTVKVVVDTREQVAALNAAIRDRLVAAGLVDDQHTTSTHSGQPVGVGDLIATRRNDHQLRVANRDTWTISHLRADGALTVTNPAAGQRVLPGTYVRAHIELAYATTAHGAQGDTATTAHLVLGEHTTAASAYVGMTRGREANTAQLVAGDLDAAREQWLTVFGRDRADLGPANAAREAARYPPTPTPRPHDLDRLAALVEQVHAAWTEQAHAHAQLRTLKARREHTQREVDLNQRAEAVLAPLREQMHTVREEAQRAEQHAGISQAVLTERAEQVAAALRAAWDVDLTAAAHAAVTVHAGTGRLGIHRGRVRTAQQQLEDWVGRWQPVCGDLLANRWLATAPDAFPSSSPRVAEALVDYAQHRAAVELPDHVARLRSAERARAAATQAGDVYYQTVTEILRRDRHDCG